MRATEEPEAQSEGAATIPSSVLAPTRTDIYPVQMVRRRILIGIVGALAAWLAYLALDGVAFNRRYPSPPSSPVEGRITELSGDSRGLNLIQIRAVDGKLYEVRVNPKFDYGPDLWRLEEFQEQDRPVVIEFEREGGSALATAITRR